MLFTDIDRDPTSYVYIEEINIMLRAQEGRISEETEVSIRGDESPYHSILSTWNLTVYPGQLLVRSHFLLRSI